MPRVVREQPTFTGSGGQRSKVLRSGCLVTLVSVGVGGRRAGRRGIEWSPTVLSGWRLGSFGTGALLVGKGSSPDDNWESL